MSSSATPTETLQRLLSLPPLNRLLDLKLVSIEESQLTTQVEYKETLIGDPESGALHGGVISTMLDATCGAAVMLKLGALTRIATLDLRMDFLKPTTAGQTLYSRCHCYKLTQQVAFVQGTAFHKNTVDNSEDEVARTTGTFMLLLPKPGARL